MTQTGDNVTIGGATYTIATDFGNGGQTGFTASHVQIIKGGWGDVDNTFRVSKTTPLPVQIFDGIQGTTGALIDAANQALKVTGSMSLSDSNVSINDLTNHNSVTTPSVTSIIQIVGPTFGPSGPTGYAAGRFTEEHFNPVKVTGAVSGYSGGYPVSVTFSDGNTRILSGGTVGYTGATMTGHDTVMVQGMINGTKVGITVDPLRRSYVLSGGTVGTTASIITDRDSIVVQGISGGHTIGITGQVSVSKMPVGGSFEIRNLAYGRDSVAVGGIDGSTMAGFKIHGSAGQTLGVSGGALKVAIDNGVFNPTVNVGTSVGVFNATAGALYIRGATGVTAQNAVLVKGPLANDAIEVNSTAGLNTRALASGTDTVDIGGTGLTHLTTTASQTTSVASQISNMRGTTGELANLNTNLKNIYTLLNDYRTYSTTGLTADSTLRLNIVVDKENQPSSLISSTVTVSTTARTLGNNAVTSGVNIQSDPTNTQTVRVGGNKLAGKSVNGFALEPGESIFLNVSNTNLIFAKSMRGNQKVNIVGS